MYVLAKSGLVTRVLDSAQIPSDPMNLDWIEYQNWLDSGNTPSPDSSADRQDAAVTEYQWRDVELALVADQLLRVEDGDPTALPGTAIQWRDYRIKLRAWVDGAEHFPDSASRPVRPA